MKTAYICDGLDPKCSGKVHCYKYPGAVVDDEMTCRHTFDIQHAKYGSEVKGCIRFKTFVFPDGELGLFEEWSDDS